MAVGDKNALVVQIFDTMIKSEHTQRAGSPTRLVVDN